MKNAKQRVRPSDKLVRTDVRYGTCEDCGRRGVVFATGRRICSEDHRIPFCIRRREKAERRAAQQEATACDLPD